MRIVAVIVLSIALGSAASVVAATFSVGGGLNSSSMTLEENTQDENQILTFSRRYGFNASAGFDFFLNPHYSLMTALSLETRGQTLEATAPDTLDLAISKFEIHYDLIYLQIPVHAKAHFFLNPTTSLQLFTGPELGLVLSSSTTMKTRLDDESIHVTQSIKSRPFDFGFSIGAGLHIQFNAYTWFIEPSYYHGFVDVILPSDNSSSEVDESQEKLHSANRNIKVRLGLTKNL